MDADTSRKIAEITQLDRVLQGFLLTRLYLATANHRWASQTHQW